MVGNALRDIEKLPERISKKELYELLAEVRNGNAEAREKAIVHNMCLVVYRVYLRFSNTNYDIDDLISVGNLGLLNAVDTYDIEKGIEFTTYAVRCIDNIILNFLQVNKKYQEVRSTDEVLCYDTKGIQDIRLIDTISDDYDLEDVIMQKEVYKVIRELINQLSERDRMVIIMLFGFQDDIVYTQKNVATMLGMPQSNFFRLKNKLLNYLGIRLEEEGIVDVYKRTLKKC